MYKVQTSSNVSPTDIFFKLFRINILRLKIFKYIKEIHLQFRKSNKKIEIYSWLTLHDRPKQLIKYNYFKEFKNTFNRIANGISGFAAVFEYTGSLGMAAAHGKIEYIKFVCESGYGHYITSKIAKIIVDNAIINGHCSIIKYCHNSNIIGSFSIHSIDLAAKFNRLDIIEYLHINRTEGCTKSAIDFASGNGHLEIVKWLFEHRTEGCTPYALSMAASNGYIDVVKYLHSKSVSISPNALDWAASNGHLHIVVFLHLTNAAKCTTRAMDLSACSGHLDIFQFLHEKRTEGFTASAFRGACLNRHYHIIEYFFQNDLIKPWKGYDLEMATLTGDIQLVRRLHGMKVPSKHSVDLAAELGYNDILQYFTANGFPGCTQNAMNMAAFNGHLSTVKWLHENRSEGCTVNAMSAAATNGHLKVVEFLHLHRTEGCHSSTIASASIKGHHNIVKYLLENRSEGTLDVVSALRTATSHSHMHIVSYLMSFPKPLFNTPSLSLDDAARVGDFEIVKYICENHYTGASTPTTTTTSTSISTLANSINSSEPTGIFQIKFAKLPIHYEINKYMIEKFHSPITHNALNESISYSRLECFKLFIENRHLALNVVEEDLIQLLSCCTCISIIDFYNKSKSINV